MNLNNEESMILVSLVLTTIFFGFKFYKSQKTKNQSPLTKIAKDLKMETKNLSLSSEDMRLRGLNQKDINDRLTHALSKTAKL